MAVCGALDLIDRKVKNNQKDKFIIHEKNNDLFNVKNTIYNYV